MSEELEYLKSRLDDVLSGQLRLEEKVDTSSAKLADKLDGLREAQATQRAELTANAIRLAEHARILVVGNGQPPLTVRMAQAESRLSALTSKKDDPATVTKQRLINWGKIITLVGLVVSQALAWVFGLVK